MTQQIKMTMDRLEGRTMFSAAATPAVVGYLPDYQVANVQNADTGKLDKIDWNSLTQLNYFSIVPNADGTLPTTTSSGGSMAQLDEVVNQAHAHGVKVEIVVGGAGLDSNLFNISNDWNTWNTFTNSIQDFANQHKLDGIDLDCEVQHPAAYQISNYGDFISHLRNDLSSNLTLSAAVYATPLSIATDADPTGESYSTFQWQLNDTAVANLDQIGVMDYDLDYADHSALQPSEDNMTAWVDHVGSANKTKLLFGVPFYGKAGTSWGTSQNESYANIIDKALQNGGELWASTDQIDEAFDDQYDGNTATWYYNGKDTISAKTQFAIDNHLGGVMAWDLGQDHVSGTDNTSGQVDDLSLLSTIGNTMRSNGYSTSVNHNLFSNSAASTSSVDNDVLTLI